MNTADFSRSPQKSAETDLPMISITRDSIQDSRTAFVGRLAQTLHVETRHLVGPKPFAGNDLF